MGILGMVALGLLTKFAFDSDKGLQAVSRFKVEMLENFRSRGLEEVSYRRIRPDGGSKGLVLKMIAEPESIAANDPLHAAIAEFYLEKFPSATHSLKLTYQPRARWGCSAQVPFLEKEFSIAELRAEIQARKNREQLVNTLRSKHGLELVAVERDREVLRVQVAWGGEQGEEVKAALPMRSVGRDVAVVYRPARGSRIVVQHVNNVSAGEVSPPSSDQVVPEAGGEPNTPGSKGDVETPDAPTDSPILDEAVFDFHGRPLRAGR